MVKKIGALVLFILAMIFVIKGNTIEGYKGLLVMLLGLIIILSELYLYNRQYQ